MGGAALDIHISTLTFLVQFSFLWENITHTHNQITIEFCRNNNAWLYCFCGMSFRNTYFFCVSTSRNRCSRWQRKHQTHPEHKGPLYNLRKEKQQRNTCLLQKWLRLSIMIINTHTWLIGSQIFLCRETANPVQSMVRLGFHLFFRNIHEEIYLYRKALGHSKPRWPHR